MGDDLFVLGEDHSVEDNVTLGRLPDREIEISPLVVGKNANVRSGSTLYACTTIGDCLETGHGVVIREQNRIGDRLSVWSYSVIDYGCILGSGIKIHTLCYIAQFTEIEDDVFIGPGVIVTNDFHPGCDQSSQCMQGPRICSRAIIGGNATLLPRVVVGARALVGAGSVVTRDVATETVVAGNPARVIGSIFDARCHTGLAEMPYLR